MCYIVRSRVLEDLHKYLYIVQKHINSHLNHRKDMTMDRSQLAEYLDDGVVELTRTGSKKLLYCSNNINIIPDHLPEGVTTLDELVCSGYIWMYVINENRWRKLGLEQIGEYSRDLREFDVSGERLYMTLRSNIDSPIPEITRCRMQILKNNYIDVPDNQEAAMVLEKILLGVRDKDTRKYLGNKEVYCNYEEVVTSCEQRTGLTYSQLTELVTKDTFHTVQQKYKETLFGWTKGYRDYLYDCFHYEGGIYTILEDVYHRPLSEMEEVYEDKIGFKVQ